MKHKSEKSAPASKLVTDDVHVFMAKLKHPLKSEIEAVRKIICSASDDIAEGIKWNSLSFRTTEFFATVHLRSLDRVQLVFHLGAKIRKDQPEVKIFDPAGLVKWLAPERCLVTVGAGKDVAANEAALRALVAAWIRYV